MYQYIKVPTDGTKITVNADHTLKVPDEPIIPYIEGDGTGFDITPVMMGVVDAAVRRPMGARDASAGWRSTPAPRPP
jgi:isocitrate dehydrogenase